MPVSRFTGKVAIVTGASGGLGSVVARAFLKEGARVVAVGRRNEALVGLREAADAAVLLTVAADLAAEGGAEEVVRRTVEWAARLDIVVNSVGAYAGGQRIGDTAPAQWEAMLDVNLRTALRMTRAALPALIRSGGGRIVNVSSRSAQRIGPNAAAYTVAKAALETLTLAAAEEYREQGVTVNAVAPSTIATPAMLAEAAAPQRARWVPPESIARVILFLASDDAADVSGAIVPVYGRA